MSDERVRVCWCAYDGSEVCDTCTRKVYYPDSPYAETAEDEEECYPA